jgi:hypothetical protein
MNTGLQDAYNLAWKLAFVQKKLAKLELLKTYNAERLPVARKLVETTDRLFNLFVSNNWTSIFFRERILPLIVKKVITHKKGGQLAFRTVSQIGISYHSSPLSQHGSSGDFPATAPKPGDRLPYLIFTERDKEITLQDMTSPTAMTLLLFHGDNQFPESLHDLIRPYKETMVVKEITVSEETKKLSEALGVSKGGLYLVRPDMYIAYRENSDATEHFRTYLTRFFIENA